MPHFDELINFVLTFVKNISTSYSDMEDLENDFIVSLAVKLVDYLLNLDQPPACFSFRKYQTLPQHLIVSHRQTFETDSAN